MDLSSIICVGMSSESNYVASLQQFCCFYHSDSDPTLFFTTQQEKVVHNP